MVNHNGEEIKSLDFLTLFSGFLGVLNYSENLKQTSNDRILEELKHQNKDYLENILKKIEEIERKL